MLSNKEDGDMVKININVKLIFDKNIFIYSKFPGYNKVGEISLNGYKNDIQYFMYKSTAWNFTYSLTFCIQFGHPIDMRTNITQSVANWGKLK